MAKAAASGPKSGGTRTDASGAATDAFSMPNMTDPAEFVEQFRTVAEENLSKSKAALEKARAMYEEVQKEAEAGLHSAQEHSSKISMAAIDSLRANTETTFGHLEKLVSAKSLAEIVEAQTAFLRQQAEMAVDTAKTMQGLYQKAGEDMSAPAKAAAEKAMGAFKTD